MQSIRTMLQLLLRSRSERSIANELELARNTVRKYKAAFDGSGYSYLEILALNDTALSAIIYPDSVEEPDALGSPDSRLDVFESKREYFLKELKDTGVTRQLLWQEYIREHPDGYKYTQFCERLARYRQIKDVSMRITYKPGDTVMIDFAGDKLYFTDRETGEMIPCPVLVCVLPFSGYSYVEALPNASLPQLVKALNNCLRFFGGAPLNLLTDNMKQMVTKTCRYEPAFTQMIVSWAQHNNIHLQAARVRSPRDKPHVENEVKLTYSRIYAPMRKKVHHSLEELNKSILQQLKLHHRRAFQNREGNRQEVFTASEQEHLQSLPSQPYVMKHSTKSKVQRNYHVFLGEDKHFYSVPYLLVGKTLRIIYDTDLVEIYDGYTRVAHHRRSYKRYDYTYVPWHMPDAHQAYHEQRGWDSDYFLRMAGKIGPCTKQYVQRMMDARPVKEQAYRGCVGILRLADTHTQQRVENACKLAIDSASAAYRTIANIIENNRDRQITEDQQLSFKLPLHENLRGSEAYK